MLRCTNHVECIHSNFVISQNHWPVLNMLTVWGDKTNRISQVWSLFYHHTSPQDVHPRIRSTGQSASQQHTYHSSCRSTVCGEWHLTLPLTHWGRDKMAVIFQTIFSNAFSWMKMFNFRLRFHWIVFPRVQLTIFQHWFRWWLGAVQATSHYLNQWWYSLLTHICVIRPQWVK